LTSDGLTAGNFRDVHAAFATNLATTMTARSQQRAVPDRTGLDDACLSQIGRYLSPPYQRATTASETSLPVRRGREDARNDARGCLTVLAVGTGTPSPDIAGERAR
jgi:hypothetical protein